MTARMIGLTALVVLGLSPAFGASTARGESLNRCLLREAKDILEYARKHDYKNVGVLKFRIKKEGEPITDRAGPLNLDLARRLEVALILRDDALNPVNVIRNASGTAAEIRGANHLTPEGREKLFAASYPLAWGNKDVTPDAFFTGCVGLTADFRRMLVVILCYDRKRDRPDTVTSFTAAMGADDLVEAGESFLLRGGLDFLENPTNDQAVAAAAAVKKRDRPFPLAREARPLVDLEIRYGGRPVPFEIQDGRAQVPEPEIGRQVTFVLRRAPAAGKERLGVVLKVNGENTLYRERRKDLECTKWILEPGAGELTVPGFQRKENEEAGEFQVRPRGEARQKEIDYGEEFGTISLVVFREKKEEPKDLPEDEAILSREFYPKDTPRDLDNLDALQANLKAGLSRTRGWIDEGRSIKSGVIQVLFTPDPVPVQAVTIRYYQRGAKGAQPAAKPR